MKLLNGVTGFNDKNDALPPNVNGNDFKKICHSIAATVTNGKLVEYKEPTLIGTNFYQAIISILDRDVYVLLNVHYPIIAFASSIEPPNIIFIDSTHLFDHFNAYYNVVSSSEMNETVDYIELKKGFVLGNENDLNKAELKQIKYWKPRTVGEITFNYWD